MSEEYPKGTQRNPMTKRVTSDLDYYWDWEQWLEPIGAQIDTATIAVIENGESVVAPATGDIIGNKVMAKIKGGIKGKTFVVRCTITTNSVGPAGVRTESDDLYISVLA